MSIALLPGVRYICITLLTGEPPTVLVRLLPSILTIEALIPLLQTTGSGALVSSNANAGMVPLDRLNLKRPKHIPLPEMRLISLLLPTLSKHRAAPAPAADPLALIMVARIP